MKNKIFFIIAIVLILIIGVGYFIVKDRIHVRSPLLVQANALITYARGDAKVKSGSDSEWIKAVPGNRVGPGDLIKTGKKSQIDLFFHNGMALKLSSNTELLLNGVTIRRLLLKLNKGAIYGGFKKQYSGQTIQINTPTAVASVRGTKLGFEVLKQAALPKPADSDSDPAKKGADVKTLPDTDDKTPAEDKLATRVFAMSGITEIYNPTLPDDKILLAYQKTVTVMEGEPPSDPVQINDDETIKLSNHLNSIHEEVVMLISNKIRFSTGSATIKRNSFKELNRIAKLLIESGDRIRIEGHTDNKGSAGLNHKLSLKRAESIRKYLIGKGIDKKKLTVKAFGPFRPIADNRTARGRAVNRRVEFIRDE